VVSHTEITNLQTCTLADGNTWLFTKGEVLSGHGKGTAEGPMGESSGGPSRSRERQMVVGSQAGTTHASPQISRNTKRNLLDKNVGRSIGTQLPEPFNKASPRWSKVATSSHQQKRPKESKDIYRSSE
jgi:hypothetical protein